MTSATKVLVVNTGSSSVKYSVFDINTDTMVFEGSYERVTNMEETLLKIPAELKEKGHDNLRAVVHRVAHGGSHYTKPVFLTDETVKGIEEVIPLAPLHLPPALKGIEVIRRVWPNLPQVGVFDTSFHQTMPPHAYNYAVPKAWRDKGLRRYGFHGFSHKYVMLRAAQELGVTPYELRIISCHLGSGASICAIHNGVSVDTSMGLTPLEGIVMGTRCGDLDPGAYMFLNKVMGLSAEEVENALYKESGLKGLSNMSNDFRDVMTAAGEGNLECQMAVRKFFYSVVKYIGAYAAAMGGVDVIAFTGGIGERSVAIRKRICDKLDYFGVVFDDDKNANVTKEELESMAMPQIQADNSRVRVMVVQARESWMMYREALNLIEVKERKDDPNIPDQPTIPIAVSARHVHLSQESVEKLFGAGYQLHPGKELRQPGQWAAQETVTLVGPRGQIEGVRILGPARPRNQIEVSRTDSFKLGLPVPVRESGKLEGTPSVKLVGPAGEIMTDGIIIAARHIHYNDKDAERDGVKDGEYVDVDIDDGERGMTFHQVLVRVSPKFITEMHIDTDEANAAQLEQGGDGEVMLKAGGGVHNALVAFADRPIMVPEAAMEHADSIDIPLPTPTKKGDAKPKSARFARPRRAATTKVKEPESK